MPVGRNSDKIPWAKRESPELMVMSGVRSGFRRGSYALRLFLPLPVLCHFQPLRFSFSKAFYILKKTKGETK